MNKVMEYLYTSSAAVLCAMIHSSVHQTSMKYYLTFVKR